VHIPRTRHMEGWIDAKSPTNCSQLTMGEEEEDERVPPCQGEVATSLAIDVPLP
jgi:hypothetical protein